MYEYLYDALFANDLYSLTEFFSAVHKLTTIPKCCQQDFYCLLHKKMIFNIIILFASKFERSTYFKNKVVYVLFENLNIYLLHTHILKSEAGIWN